MEPLIRKPLIVVFDCVFSLVRGGFAMIGLKSDATTNAASAGGAKMHIGAKEGKVSPNMCQVILAS